MYALNYTGLTGQIEFNGQRERSNVNIDIISLNSDNFLEKVGTFKITNTPRLSFLPPRQVNSTDDQSSISKQHFNVVISLVDPYVMLVDSITKLEGNDQYEGFCIDIIKELADIYHFDYTFIDQVDKDYGSYDNYTHDWT